MRKFVTVVIVALIGLPAVAAKRVEEATIKDMQAANFAPAQQKHQQYDFWIETPNVRYQCRTSPDHSTNATDFPVGEAVTFLVNGKNGLIKGPGNKSAKCMITRVEDVQ